MIQRKQSLRRRIIKWTSIMLLTGLIIACNYLSNNVDAFKCDIVHGSDHLPGWSNTKAEAVKRTTYVCDVLLTYQPFDKKSPMQLKPLRGWVERSWRNGFWYSTTSKDTGKDITYRVTVNNPGDKRHWIVTNNVQNSYGYETINYDYDFGCQFTTYIDGLPTKDSLNFTVLKTESRHEFKPDNISGIMTLHFLNH